MEQWSLPNNMPVREYIWRRSIVLFDPPIFLVVLTFRRKRVQILKFVSSTKTVWFTNGSFKMFSLFTVYLNMRPPALSNTMHNVSVCAQNRQQSTARLPGPTAHTGVIHQYSQMFRPRVIIFTRDYQFPGGIIKIINIKSGYIMLYHR